MTPVNRSRYLCFVVAATIVSTPSSMALAASE